MLCNVPKKISGYDAGLICFLIFLTLVIPLEFSKKMHIGTSPNCVVPATLKILKF